MQASRRKHGVTSDFLAKARRYRHWKRVEAEAKAEQAKLKPLVDAYIEQNGRKTPEGHLVVSLPEPLGETTSVIRQYAPKILLDPQKAMELAIRLGILSQVTRTIVVFDTDVWEHLEGKQLLAKLAKSITYELDDDRFFGYHQLHRDVLTPELLESCFTTEETWSTVTSPPGWK